MEHILEYIASNIHITQEKQEIAQIEKENEKKWQRTFRITIF